MRLDVVVIVNDVQNAAALAVRQIRDRLIFLAALDAARALDIFSIAVLQIKYCGDGAAPPREIGS